MWSASDLEAILSLNHASEHLVTKANDSQMTRISQFFAKTPFHFPAAVMSQLQTQVKIYCNEKYGNVYCVQQLCSSGLKQIHFVKESTLFLQMHSTCVQTSFMFCISARSSQTSMTASSIGFNSSSSTSARPFLYHFSNATHMSAMVWKSLVLTIFQILYKALVSTYMLNLCPPAYHLCMRKYSRN